MTLLLFGARVDGDSTAPTLSNPTAGTPTSDGATSAGVTTNEGNGTLYWAVVTNGGSCTDAQLKAGTGGNIVSGVSGNQAVSGSGAQTIATITGLTASTAYQIKFLQRDAAGNDSSQASVDLTTTAVQDPYFSSVVLLAANDNAANDSTTFIDQSSYARTLTVTGGAKYSTAQAPTGMTSSMFGDGTNDSVAAASSANFGYGTADFTIEFMFYIGTAGVETALSQLDAGTTEVTLHVYLATTAIVLFVNGAGVITSGAVSTGTWYHLAISRVSGETKMFLNGTQTGLTYSDANNYGSKPFTMMDYLVPPTGVSTWNGYLCSIRVTKGVGRYSGTFTPPTLPMPTS